MNDIPQYPWDEGDPLYASALNAAFANMAGIAGGPFLPLAGGTVTGLTTHSAALTVSAAGTGLNVTNNATFNGGGVTVGAMPGSFNGIQSSTSLSAYIASAGTFTIRGPNGILAQVVDATGGSASSDYLKFNAFNSGAPSITTNSGSNGITINPGTGTLNVGPGGVAAMAAGTGLFGASGTTTLAGSTVPTPPLKVARNWAGTSTVSGNTALYLSAIQNAGDNASAANISNLLLGGNYGGANFSGLRLGLNVAMALNTASNIASGGLIGMSATVNANVNVGGIAGSTLGSLFGSNPVAATQTGATFWKQVIGEEIDISLASGSSANVMNGLQIVQLAGSTGSVFLSSSMLAMSGVAGSASTPIQHGITFSSYSAPSAFGAGSYLAQVQAFAGTSVAGGGFDLNQLTLSGAGAEGGGFFWRSPGVQLLSSAAQIGYGAIDGSTGGLTIDAVYQTMSATAGAITVASGGSNFAEGAIVADVYGNVMQVHATAGVVTSVAAVVARGWQKTPPANPVAFTGRSIAGPTSPDLPGTGLTLNLTWTPQTTLSLNPTGKQILTNLSAAATDAAAATAGVPIGGLYNNAGVVHVRLI